MKTNAIQQKRLIEAIQNVRVVEGIRLLREWLKDNGYEGEKDCKHYAVVRSTGACMNCKASIMDPIILGSNEALEALRARLKGD